MNLINQISGGAGGGGRRGRERLACEHSSMTSSTTELLDFMHTRPGEADRRSQRDGLVFTNLSFLFKTDILLLISQILNSWHCAIPLKKIYIISVFDNIFLLFSHKNSERCFTLVPSAREQRVLTALMSQHDITVN